MLSMFAVAMLLNNKLFFTEARQLS